MASSSLDIFFVKALDTLKQWALIPNDTKDPYSKDVIRAVDIWGGYDYLATFEEISEAMANFEKWVETWDGEYPRYCNPVLLQMTFTAPVGKGTISLSLHGALAENSDQETINKAAIQLWDSIQQTYKHLADRRGANGVNPRADAIDHQTAPLPETVPQNNANSSESYITVDLTKFSIEMKDGKALWKAHGGMWEKFGVRVWPEVLDAAGVKHEGRTKGGNVKGKMTVLVKRENGKDKPVRVTELVIERK